MLERRRIFIADILIFAGASLLGRFATDQTWLLSARALQGAGGAMAAPTALSLIAVTFPEGPPRNRAMVGYASMSAVGAAGLIAGGLLLGYLNWRWVLFVNMPIGLLVAALATCVPPESQRRIGRYDLPGAFTRTLGVTALVYGLSSAAISQNGVLHWGDTKVIASLAAAAVLLAAFAVIEVRSTHALLPIRVLLSRDLTGSYLIGGSIGLALLGTVAWSAVATSLRSQTAAAAGHPLTAATQTQIQHDALAAGFSHGFLVTAAIGLLALIITLAAIRVTREDLSGVDPLAAPAD
jgi:MFS family permease